MPLQVWNIPTFRTIGSNWGQFLQVNEYTMKETSYEKGRILIATKISEKIEGTIELMVEGKKYMVKDD